MNLQLSIDIQGANAEQLRRGLSAAHRVLKVGGISPVMASHGLMHRERWYAQAFEGDAPSKAQMHAAELWDAADSAALHAACEGWEQMPTTANLWLFDTDLLSRND